MNLSLRPSNGLLALTEGLAGSSRAVHKYSVLSDHRRTDPFWSKYAEGGDLSKVVVEHTRSVKIHAGHVAGTRWTEPERARDFLLAEGVGVVDDDGELHQRRTTTTVDVEIGSEGLA